MQGVNQDDAVLRLLWAATGLLLRLKNVACMQASLGGMLRLLLVGILNLCVAAYILSTACSSCKF